MDNIVDGLFPVPKYQLQQRLILRGNTLEENISDYLNIVWNKNRPIFDGSKELTCSDDLDAVQAIANAEQAKEWMKEAVDRDAEGSNRIDRAMKMFNKRRNDLLEEINKLEFNSIENIRKRDITRLETINKVEEYVKVVEGIKKEREKHDILLKIGFIIESLMNELEPYETVLGKLILQENTFKSKAETLSMKSHVMMERRKSLNEKLEEDLTESEAIKNKLFGLMFKMSEKSHSGINKINKLHEKDIKSMRKMLDIENRVALLRKSARAELAETAYFYKFLDWVLCDIIGEEYLVGITRQSSPTEITQAIIEYYKNLRIMLSRLETEKINIVDQIF